MPGMMTDGYQTLITFNADSSIKLYEKSVTPPGVVGGGAIDVTTQQTSTWREKASKSLKELGNASLNVAWDPAVYPEIISIINVIDLITVTFPDASALSFYGWLDEFTPGEMVEGEQPTADCTIIPSQRQSDGTAAAPGFTTGA